jgi:hypothetical protein
MVYRYGLDLSGLRYGPLVKSCEHSNEVSPSWTNLNFKVKALCSSKMSGNTNPVTQHHIPEDLNPQFAGSIQDLEFLD